MSERQGEGGPERLPHPSKVQDELPDLIAFLSQGQTGGANLDIRYEGVQVKRFEIQAVEWIPTERHEAPLTPQLRLREPLEGQSYVLLGTLDKRESTRVELIRAMLSHRSPEGPIHDGWQPDRAVVGGSLILWPVPGDRGAGSEAGDLAWKVLELPQFGSFSFNGRSIPKASKDAQ